ncbi:hypothetical protein [Sphingomonas sp. VNH70]|uniref:hypothetical protein n=1 Tax=Sphingomonas silueang TaxID=3156617 RepID=UPI0032B5197E
MKIVVARNRPLQRRIKTHGWTEARRKAMLEELAASCNVEASCRAIGMSKGSFYKLRARDADYSEQCRQAMLAGYERLETELLRKAIATVEDEPGDDAPGGVLVGQMTVEQAMRLLERFQYNRNKDATPRRQGWSRATQAETDAMLAQQIKALKKRHENKA